MSYVEYKGLKTPNEVLSAIADFLKNKSFNVIQDVADDLNIYDRTSSDGKKFVVNDITRDYVLNFRSANGTNIFGTTSDDSMENTTVLKNSNYYGVGLTISAAYSSVQRWYNQYNVPVKWAVGSNNKEVLGCWLPVPMTLDNQELTYTLFCNYVSLPSNTILFTLMRENSSYMQVAHLCIGHVTKYEEWEGGIYMSASANSHMMATALNCFKDAVDADKAIFPLFCSSATETCTFVRIDIDDAPTDARGSILWASSGADNITGKQLALPIRDSLNTNGKIPNYYYLQSKSRLDSGRNVNTLNCITINLPIYMAVIVDPDVLENYAPIGVVSGVYFISTLNVQTSHVYEMSYPESSNTCQVFPMGKRRGYYGFDGISFKQTED